jgi:ubiquitin C-terminal hydrolase
MSKQVNYSHIATFKTEFDLLYKNYISSTEPQKVQHAVERMMQLQDKINDALDRAPVNVSRYFTWRTTSTTPVVAIDAEKTKSDTQEKIALMLSHSTEVLSLVNRVEPIAKPTPPPSVDLGFTNQASKASDTQSPKAVDLAVGFGNSGANCWANSLLSMILSMPNFKRAYEAVANHYAQDHTNPQNQHYGTALANALQAYETALASKQPVPVAISQDVRLAFNHFFGNVNPITNHEIFSKLAYRQEDAWEGMQMLMGHYEQITRQNGNTNPLPGPYSLLQTKRHYRPIGRAQPADPEKLRRDDYSRLTGDNISSVINDDYQIIVDLQNKGHLSFRELLSEYFRNTHLQGHDTSTYLLPNGQVQQFELIGEGRQFVQAPEELLLTIKRFGANMEGVGFKIATPLAIPQTLVLPADAITTHIPVAYELDAFNVHSGDFGGGHYIAYRKINGQWIEANDSCVRLVSAQEIDQILFGQKGTHYTSYMHHYARIPEQGQREAIASANIAPSLVRDPAIGAEKASQEMLACQHSIKQLEALTSILSRTDTRPSDLTAALQELEKGSPEIVDRFRYALWVNDKTPDVYDYGTTTLKNNPKKLQEIKLPWFISPSGANLIEQTLIVQRRKLEIATEKFQEAQLRTFFEKVKSSEVSNEELLVALQTLPEQVQNSLHGLVYQSHLKKFGESYVNKEEYQSRYGKVALEQGDIRKTLTEAKESVLNLWGTNIIEQLISDYSIKAEKLQCAYEKEQLQGFHDLMLHAHHEISNYQLLKAFERLDIRNEIKEKLYWHIWYGHRMPQVHDYGTSTFKNNPRALLGICQPNLAKPPVCATGSNILYQMIKLLEKESR